MSEYLVLSMLMSIFLSLVFTLVSVLALLLVRSPRAEMIKCVIILVSKVLISLIFS